MGSDAETNGTWTPGVKDYPPAWVCLKYDGFDDLENNALFCYIIKSEKITKPVWEVFKLSTMTAEELLNGIMGGQLRANAPWYMRHSVFGAMLSINSHLRTLGYVEETLAESSDQFLWIAFLGLPLVGVLLFKLCIYLSVPYWLAPFPIFLAIPIFFYWRPSSESYNKWREKQIDRINRRMEPR